MQGFIGFILAALSIGAFVLSGQRAYLSVEASRLKAFWFAFWCLVAAMILWAIIVISNDQAVTHHLMLASDLLLLVGTAAMIVVILQKYSSILLAALATGAALLINYRAYVDPPTAYVQKGLLYFNLQGSSRLFIVGMFALIWLPAMMIVGNRVADDPLLRRRRYSLQMYFVLLVALVAMFAKAQRAAAIVALFALIIFVFLLITVFNIMLDRAHHGSPAKRSNPHAPGHTPAE